MELGITPLLHDTQQPIHAAAAAVEKGTSCRHHDIFLPRSVPAWLGVYHQVRDNGAGSEEVAVLVGNNGNNPPGSTQWKIIPSSLTLEGLARFFKVGQNIIPTDLR